MLFFIGFAIIAGIVCAMIVDEIASQAGPIMLGLAFLFGWLIIPLIGIGAIIIAIAWGLGNVIKKALNGLYWFLRL